MLISSLILLLLSNAVTSRRDKSILYSRLTIIIFIYSSLIIFNNFASNINDIALFNNLFHSTALTVLFHMFIFIITSFILQMNSFYPRRVKYNNNLVYKNISNLYEIMIQNKSSKQFRIIEYPLIIVFIIIGASLLISSSNIISLFMSLELQSYGLYILSAMYRDSESSTWAALTYFLLGGLSSCLILLSASLLYANSGITNLDGFYLLSNLLDINNTTFPYESNYINYSLIIISVGFLFKVSAAPFHFWSPDVYDAIPTIVTTFVAIISKISILVLLLELIHYTSSYIIYFNFSWLHILLFSSLLSMIIGTILGLTQFRIKRLFAYSTISHIGFILLALSINNIESNQAFIFYIIQYSISNLNAFLLIMVIGSSLYRFVNKDKQYLNIRDKNNSSIQLISQIIGYYYINPVLAISLAITLLSFAGIPPLMGFFAKQMVLSAAISKEYIFITLIAILTSTVSALYYLNIIKEMFFNSTKYIYNSNLIRHKTSNNDKEHKDKEVILANSMFISISTLLMLMFIFIPQNLLSMTNILAITLFKV